MVDELIPMYRVYCYLGRNKPIDAEGTTFTENIFVAATAFACLPASDDAVIPAGAHSVTHECQTCAEARRVQSPAASLFDSLFHCQAQRCAAMHLIV